MRVRFFMYSGLQFFAGYVLCYFNSFWRIKQQKIKQKTLISFSFLSGWGKGEEGEKRGGKVGSILWFMRTQAMAPFFTARAHELQWGRCKPEYGGVQGAREVSEGLDTRHTHRWGSVHPLTWHNRVWCESTYRGNCPPQRPCQDLFPFRLHPKVEIEG